MAGNTKRFGVLTADGGYPASATVDGTETTSWVQGGVTVTGTLQDIADLAGSGGTPGGSDTQVQFNDAGAFGGDAGFTYSKTTDTATLVNLVLSGKLNEAKGADIASAATTDIGAATGTFVHVTGTTTITALGTVQAGTRRIVRFAGILILTHNATSLILPTAANITTAANDTAEFVSEGSGNWRCTGYLRASGAALSSSGGGLTNWTDAISTAAPNATVNVASLTVNVASASGDAVIAPKGTGGGLAAAVANNLASGGNKRGSNAVDWQTNRSNNTEVASGASSVIPGGQNNTASGTHAFASGQMSTVSGNHGFAHGQNNNATASQAIAMGGSCTASAANAVAIGASCTADGINSYATGSQASTRALFGACSHAVGTGKQRFELLLQRATTDATPTALTTTGTAATAANQFIVPGNRACNVEGRVTARNTTTGDSKSWRFDALVKNIANVTTLEGAVTPTVLYAAAGAAAWTIAIAADDANEVMTVTATGAAATNIAWTCDLHCVET